ncbi:Poly(ADP-ribose) polymerase catalytic domain [Pelomyxa schiedti]|nr:Poly(ADP-ribose) polymerase catalytic domain [Pelomyxa schiedti]
MIQKYVTNTHPRSTPAIKNIYRVDRAGESDRFEPSKVLGNRKLLWHGSRLTNFVGIISQGLRIAPPEAPASGYRFGKGLYFADIAQLASRYCRSQNSDVIIHTISLHFPVIVPRNHARCAPTHIALRSTPNTRTDDTHTTHARPNSHNAAVDAPKTARRELLPPHLAKHPQHKATHCDRASVTGITLGLPSDIP